MFVDFVFEILNYFSGESKSFLEVSLLQTRPVGSHFSEFPDLLIAHSSGYPSHWGLAGLPPSLGIENVAPDTLVRLG